MSYFSYYFLAARTLQRKKVHVKYFSDGFQSISADLGTNKNTALHASQDRADWNSAEKKYRPNCFISRKCLFIIIHSQRHESDLTMTKLPLIRPSALSVCYTWPCSGTHEKGNDKTNFRLQDTTQWTICVLVAERGALCRGKSQGKIRKIISDIAYLIARDLS